MKTKTQLSKSVERYNKIKEAMKDEIANLNKKKKKPEK